MGMGMTFRLSTTSPWSRAVSANASYNRHSPQAYSLNMSDEELVLRAPPSPEATQPPAHPSEQKRATVSIWISCIAIVFALLAALGSIWQAHEVRQTRLNAEKVLNDQAKDVERARKAAEESATAAKLLADVGRQGLSISDRGALASERSARAAEQSLKTSKDLFAEGRRAE